MIRAVVLAVFLALAVRGADVPPKLMLWAWERNTDLRFLKPADAGVAYYFAALRLTPDGHVQSAPRREPLLLAPGAYRLPVVRLDADPKAPLSDSQRAETLAMLIDALQITRAHALQIDFDAPVSARTFYRALLNDLRHHTGPSVFLSMTALASWCHAGSWMAGLPVDEMVPMLFRLGYPPSKLPEEFAFPGCRASAGVELGSGLKPRRGRLYVFPGYREWSAKLFSDFAKP